MELAASQLMRAIFQYRRNAGVALVITLLCLALLVALAVGFLGNVSTNRASSATDHGIALTQSLSDSVVELVKVQIVEGTKSQVGGSDRGWASQPGMIRTFNLGGGKGSYYKLYSASEMVKDGSAYNETDDAPTGTEVQNRAVWADINRPAFDPDGVTLSYPVVNPNAAGPVEGFACAATNAWGYDSTKAAGPWNNPAPMPVRWLYVLRDGSMVPAVASGNASATVAGATPANPIVGRVAFWTDDDTCKVNLNTASEGTFWDVPRANTATERLFSSLQPVKNEFQRYPGHPALTCLSSVFGSWLPAPSPVTSGNYAALSKYYRLAPRINDTTSPNSGGPLNGTLAGTQSLDTAMSPITVDTDRLYTSTDEFLFSALGTAPPMATPRAINDTALTRKVIESTRFFTTTDSRAPDVNLFGQPRITIWPLYPTTAPSLKWTPVDRLIDFCSTIGGRRYAFTRGNPDSATADYAGGAPAGPAGATGMRNQELFNYLIATTSRPVPGFPNQTFVDKYTSDERDQILTQIFDFIRSSAPAYGPGTNIDSPNFSSSRLVAPIFINGKKGFGSFKTINEVDVLFYAYDSSASPTGRYMQVIVLPHLYFPHVGYTDNTNCLLQIAGLSSLTVDTGSGPIPLGITGTSSRVNCNSWAQTAGFEGAGYGLTPLMFGGNFGNTPKPLGRTDVDREYPFYSDPIPIPGGSSGTFAFSGGSLSIRLCHPTASTTIQTINVIFPQDPNIPYPKPATSPTIGLNASSTFSGRYSFASPPSLGQNSATYYFAGDMVRGVVIDPSGLARGDVRMVAGLTNVPSNYFAPIASTVDIRTNVRGSRLQEPLAISSGNLVQGISNYRFGPNTSCTPFVPPGLNGAFLRTASGSNAPGDWTTSMGVFADSAGIDLPDFFAGSAATHFGGLQGGSSLALLGNVFYSPNRTMPSPVVFGSLPTGVWRAGAAAAAVSAATSYPWQTLLFCPNSAATISGATHPGSVTPPDHLLLDLFKMPVVEPYAISDPFSTAGKINLNYQIAPFSHITRKTGIHALLKSARLFAVPDADVNSYKIPGRLGLSGVNLNRINGAPTGGDYRLRINPDQTTAAFDAKFAAGDIFRSASQLCEMFLYPMGTPYDSSAVGIRNFWSQRQLTGDNMREIPYRDLYGRVTTQSNTYTVHYIVQALKKTPNGAAGVWTEGVDKVVGEYRGSSSIERYIDPEDPRFKSSPPDFATTPGAANRMDSYYRIRTLGTRRFAP